MDRHRGIRHLRLLKTPVRLLETCAKRKAFGYPRSHYSQHFSESVTLTDLLSPSSVIRSPEICTTVVGMPSIEVVQENVETAKLASLSAEEAACLKEVRAILEPVHNVTWPSGLPENN